MPVIVALDFLDEEALVRILEEPKNALSKQYKRLFELDGVELEFEDGALREVAKKAIARGTGARGLRAIMEKIMLDIMYDMPSRDDIKKVVITKDVIDKEQEPTLVLVDKKPARKKEKPA